MAVPLVGLGGYFTRNGKNIDFYDKQVLQMDLIDVEVDDILDQYEEDREFAVALENGREGYKTSAGAAISTLNSTSLTTLIEMVHADDPLPSKSLDIAFTRLREQMIASSDTINGTTVSSATVANAANVGNGLVVVSLKDERGNVLEYVRDEDIVVSCTTDAQLSGTPGRETFTLAGELEIARNNQAWPAGSGLGGTLTSVDSSIDGGPAGSNKLTNSDFETFTANLPDDWVADVGSAGVDFSKTSTSHRLLSALSFNGDGATLTDLTQVTTLKPNTKYMMGIWVRDDGTGPAAGSLTISLTDTAGTIFNTADPILTTASFVVDLTAVASVYVFNSVSFETPTQLPVGAQVSIRLDTALESGRSVFIDDMMLIEMRQLGGLGGPFMAIVPGDTDFIREDRFITTITNNAEGEFIRGLDRMLNLYPTGLYFPSKDDASETIPDSLIS